VILPLLEGRTAQGARLLSLAPSSGWPHQGQSLATGEDPDGGTPAAMTSTAGTGARQSPGDGDM
jgi:hypothetical protein